MKSKLTNIVLALSIVFFVFTVLLYLVPTKSNSFIFGVKPFIISTGSMEPSYPVHTIVVIRTDSPNSVQVGDPIAFRAAALSGEIAFHRVVAITSQGFITQGDANPSVDPIVVSYDDYVGSEVFHTKLLVGLYAFWAATMAHPTYGLLILLALLVFFFASRYFWPSQRLLR